MGEKTTWRIICEDGSWVGRSLNCGKTNKMENFCGWFVVDISGK